MNRAGAGLCQSGRGDQGAWSISKAQGNTPFRTLAVPGECRVRGPQSQRAQMGQGKLLVRPGQRMWLGIAHMVGVDQVTGRPERGRRPPCPRAASRHAGLAEQAGLSGAFPHERDGMRA